jgi:hypothetical protein
LLELNYDNEAIKKPLNILHDWYAKEITVGSTIHWLSYNLAFSFTGRISELKVLIYTID